MSFLTVPSGPNSCQIYAKVK